MVDFSKHKRGDVVAAHCCDSCAIKTGVKPKRPADSGKASWLCDVCGHHGIGSLTDCEIGDWLRLRPLQPSRATAVSNREWAVAQMHAADGDDTNDLREVVTDNDELLSRIDAAIEGEK